jgi:hypothetical protein
MLTKEEQNIIGWIVSDDHSGRDLLRTNKDWERIDISREDYYKKAKEVYDAVHNFKLDDVIEQDVMSKDVEIAMYYALCSNCGFHDLMNNLMDDDERENVCRIG